MADFPENDIQILNDDDVSAAFIEGVRAGFSRDVLVATTSFDDFGPVAKRDQLKRIAAARKTILRVFTDPPVLQRLDRLRAIGNEMSKGNFPTAQTQLTELVNLPPVAFQFDFNNAFNTSPVNFFTIELVDNPTPGKPPIKKQVPGTIPPYVGPKPGDQPGRRLVALNDFLSKGPEHRFRIGVLQAEIDAGRGRFREAITGYDALLAAAAAGSPRRKFVALRSAFAHVNLADQLFRGQRVLPDQDRRTIADLYGEAVQLLDEHGVSPENPLRQHVEAHASQQTAKVQNGLNYFGLWDAFVPNQRFTTLQQAAAAQIQLAKGSVQAFMTFVNQADDEKEKQRDLEFQRTEERLNLDILERKRAISILSVDKIDEQISAIDDQQKFLAAETVIGHFRAVVEGAARGGEIGGVTSVLGVAGNIVNFLDQNQQLEHQRRLAQLEGQIARNQLAIVGTERRISEARIDFYAQKLGFLQGKRLNADVLYELAGLNERRAVRQLETAVLLAYLFELALNFNLGEVGSRRIQFDYLDRPAGILDAVNALDDDFNLVASQVDTLLQQQKIDPFIESISLRETYPIQFNRFLQTGEMDFVYSLYQLSKSRPATHQCRLRQLGVEIRGLVPPTGFSGIVTHSGRFLVRDRDGTVLDAAVTRLVPTDDQLADALEEQRRAGLAAAVVGGVLFYSLDPESKELSQKTQFVSPDPPSQVSLDLFEGIGPTGLWHLEIREHGKLAISDVLLHFAIVSRESDPFVLEPKVEALVESFERELAEGDLLDKISSFSLRQKFPDALAALQNGPADFALTAEDFEKGLTDLRFKAVIAQALDQAGKGVAGIALGISRPDAAFELARVTRSDGFSEDLDAPPQTLPRDQRFPLNGTWKLRLSDPAQFGRLGDIRLFFIYSFEEL